MGVGQETLLATVALVPLSVESKLFSPDPESLAQDSVLPSCHQ